LISSALFDGNSAILNAFCIYLSSFPHFKIQKRFVFSKFDFIITFYPCLLNIKGFAANPNRSRQSLFFSLLF